MPIVRARSWVAAPIDEVFRFFDDPANLARLMPPPVRIRTVRVEPMPPQVGTEIEFRYGIGPIQRSWVVRYVEHVPGARIVDATLSGPVRRFLHSHTFRAGRGGGTWIEDRIDFHVGPKGWPGALLDGIATIVVRLTFVWRSAMQRRILRG